MKRRGWKSGRQIEGLVWISLGAIVAAIAAPIYQRFGWNWWQSLLLGGLTGGLPVVCLFVWLFVWIAIDSLRNR